MTRRLSSIPTRMLVKKNRSVPSVDFRQHGGATPAQGSLWTSSDHKAINGKRYGVLCLNMGSSGKSVLFPSDSTTVGYVEDFLRHDSGVRWFLVRSSYQTGITHHNRLTRRFGQV